MFEKGRIGSIFPAPHISRNPITTIVVDSDGVVRTAATAPGLYHPLTLTGGYPYQGHLGPDGTTEYNVSIAECIAADWSAEAYYVCAHAKHEGLPVVLPAKCMQWSTEDTLGTPTEHYLGTRTDVFGAHDPFSGDDDWPAMCVRGFCSPYIRLGEVVGHLSGPNSPWSERS